MLFRSSLLRSTYSICISRQTYRNVVIVIPALGLGSPKLKVEVNTPKGKAPMPKDMWKPSPNPKPGNPLLLSGSVRCPAGRGGTYK